MSTLYGNEARGRLSAAVSCWPAFELEEGQQVHMNDGECGDTRGRLYIIKKANAILFHCHNCGTSGHFTLKESWKRIEAVKDVDEVRSSVTALNVLANPCKYDALPLDAQLWLAQYEMQDLTPISYSGDRLWIPIMAGDLVIGEQGRLFATSAIPRAKYLTRYSSVVPGRRFSIQISDYDLPLYIVEDLLSAHKICKVGGNALAMCGTSLNVATLLAAVVKHAVLWLDPDEAGASGALELTRQLSPLFSTVNAVFESYEPKEIPLEDLKRMVHA